MKTCRYVRKKLSAYQDGEVALAEKDFIEVHLRSCEACSQQFEAFGQTYRILQKLPVIQPTNGLSRQILGRVTQTQKSFGSRALAGAFHLLPRPAAMVTLALVGLLAGFFLGNLITAGQIDSSTSFSAPYSDQALTLASVQVFNATPPGSFAGGYLKLAIRSQEINHEK